MIIEVTATGREEGAATASGCAVPGWTPMMITPEGFPYQKQGGGFDASRQERFVKVCTRSPGAAGRGLLGIRFIRLLSPRRGLLEGAGLGIVSAMRFLRKVVRRGVGTVLTCAKCCGGSAEYDQHEEMFHRRGR